MLIGQIIQSGLNVPVWQLIVSIRGVSRKAQMDLWLAPQAIAPVKAIEQSGESPVQSKRYRSVAEGNCVFNRKGGKQLEAKEQSVT